MSSDDQHPSAAVHRIVIIDDHPDAAEMCCMLLEGLGHDCHSEVTGGAGIDMAVALKPDLVICDIGLPDMSGYDVARRLRAELGPTVFLAAMTGWGTDADRANAFAAGFDLHVLKPPDAGMVRAILAAAESREKG